MTRQALDGIALGIVVSLILFMWYIGIIFVIHCWEMILFVIILIIFGCSIIWALERLGINV